MSGRHRSRGPLRRGRLRVPLALSGVAALVAVTAITVRIVAADAAGCAGGIALRVVATPEIAPVLEEVGAGWTRDKPAGKRQVRRADRRFGPLGYRGQQPTVFAGRAIDVAAKPEPTPSEDALPTVWVPDSTAWLARVQTIDRSAFEAGAREIASSPVVVAMPEAAAKQVGWPAKRLQIAALKPLLAQGTLQAGHRRAAPRDREPRRHNGARRSPGHPGRGPARPGQDLPQRGADVEHRRTAALVRSEGHGGPGVGAGRARLQRHQSFARARRRYSSIRPRRSSTIRSPSARALPRETAQAAALFRGALLAGRHRRRWPAGLSARPRVRSGPASRRRTGRPAEPTPARPSPIARRCSGPSACGRRRTRRRVPSRSSTSRRRWPRSCRRDGRAEPDRGDGARPHRAGSHCSPRTAVWACGPSPHSTGRCCRSTT